MKKNQTQIKKYAAVISIFLAAVIVGLFVFFFCIKRSVEQRSKNTMRNNVVRQSEHLRTILDIQYDYLNDISRRDWQDRPSVSKEEYGFDQVDHKTYRFWWDCIDRAKWGCSL